MYFHICFFTTFSALEVSKGITDTPRRVCFRAEQKKFIKFLIIVFLNSAFSHSKVTAV